MIANTSSSREQTLGRAAVFAVSLLAALTISWGATAFAEPTRNITIDGQFSDWAAVPAYTDPTNDQHDTDHSGQFDTPAYVNHPDVDVLEYKFAHDANNLYAYFKATGSIGRTQQQPPGSRPGRYYVIVTIDVDNNDDTGYWLHEGGYYPTSRGYDMNMELEFYNGTWNTGHYLSHDALTQAGLDQDTRDLTSGAWTSGNDGPYTPGFVNPAAGNYDNYTQWVYQNDNTLMLVADKGPIVPGIMSMAISPDGHEIEFCAPFKGFLSTSGGAPNVALGKTIDISMSLEASGELFATAGNGTWASDTTAPINGYVLEIPEPASVWLVGLGAAIVGWGGRRRPVRRSETQRLDAFERALRRRYAKRQASGNLPTNSYCSDIQESHSRA